MAEWVHTICYSCWNIREGHSVPHRMIEENQEECCFCGDLTSSGIYVRHDPTSLNLRCKGDHSQPIHK